MVSSLQKPSISKITDQEVKKVDFFHDFILYLRYLKKGPIKTTPTARISLSNAQPLLTKLKTTKQRYAEFKRYGWKVRSENQLETLTQIKVIAAVMHLTYKRKGKILLSSNGREYLSNISSAVQYWNMVLWFWQRVNWGYFSFSREIDGLNIAETLQAHQDIIWKNLLERGKEWVEFPSFCQVLKFVLNLWPYCEDGRNNFSLHLDIKYGLIRRNLERFGCIEAEYKKAKYSIKEILRFRSTSLGLFMYQKALSEPL